VTRNTIEFWGRSWCASCTQLLTNHNLRNSGRRTLSGAHRCRTESSGLSQYRNKNCDPKIGHTHKKVRDYFYIRPSQHLACTNESNVMPPKRTWSEAHNDTTSPASRPRLSDANAEPSVPLVSRKVKACASCRKQKVPRDLTISETRGLHQSR
jgi:hypothetical protein